MEILCACDERYLPHVATMLCSLLEHNGVCTIHLLHDSIRAAELTKLRSLVERYGSGIVFYEVTQATLSDLRVDKWASIAVYYRLLAPQLLPVDKAKVLYLDADIVVRGPLNNLWNTNVDGRALAAVPNYEDGPRKALGLPEGVSYFNSGVMLLNLHFWRENGTAKAAMAFTRDNPEKVQFWDQDALNAVLVKKWVALPPCWNWQYWERPSESEPEPVIVHFITSNKPWHWTNAHPFKHEYHQYRLKTPWRRYKPEGRPRLPYVRAIAKRLLPARCRLWLRSHGASNNG
jgi:lipopolysaccharide biosynthesis glycosyltransferase